ncbi:MAG: squalene/phytoene synthase family protein [Phycisphaeraceae bacterium]|nr:squalene/phytoene synthase family protein [Phycisphaeraceae bacterium]
MTDIAKLLDSYGPDRCDTMTTESARAWCARMARQSRENFSVLTSLVPEDRRDDFAALYAFCRWADDLGDEMGSPERSLELLGWWRRELEACFAGAPRHPVFTALHPTIVRHDLPIAPFDDLIRAFEWDQRRTRWETWDELMASCRLSADPVGRLVLMILGEPRDADHFEPSDRICTALQLTNHWQDVRRDWQERGRLYIPREFFGAIPDFERRLERTVALGYAPDRDFLELYRGVLRQCIDRTWAMWEAGEVLLQRVAPAHRPIIWLFCAGGRHVLSKIEAWGLETCITRPRLARVRKATLVLQALWMARAQRRRAGSTAAPSVPSAARVPA